MSNFIEHLKLGYKYFIHGHFTSLTGFFDKKLKALMVKPTLKQQNM